MKSARTVLLISLTMLGGCTTYYRVTDPSTGKQYYTTNIKEDSGTTKLHDSRTDSDVSIQNSEVMKISEQQFNEATHMK